MKRPKENAEKFVESVIIGDHYASIEDLKEALDYKAFIRADPHMRHTGATMERQLFGDKVMIDKYLYMMKSMSSN